MQADWEGMVSANEDVVCFNDDHVDSVLNCLVCKQRVPMSGKSSEFNPSPFASHAASQGHKDAMAEHGFTWKGEIGKAIDPARQGFIQPPPPGTASIAFIFTQPGPSFLGAPDGTESIDVDIA